ncbi:MAG TPA: ParB/RepB/Spo0J family partition protein, partial [Isosphaeraceae bacterium]|nr:ParB/RepB/Spo0J family partition protein [Isosphaeraceae bacterium]
MKAADQLMARLGGNMAESMGPANGPAVVPSAAVLHGGAEKYKGAARIKDALAIKLEQIAPDPNQPRKEFDAESLEELAASLKARGQLQPIRVRWDESLIKWIIISGERRYRAAVLAGLPSLTCIETTRPLTEEDLLEDQLVENALRQDLKPIEQARA